MQRLTRDWLALVVLAGGAQAVGVAASLQLLPYVLLSLLAGRMADRFPTPWVVLLGNLSGLLLSGLMALAVATDTLTLPLLYVFVASLGAVTALEGPSRTRLLSDLVPRQAIPSSVSWRSAGYEGAHLVGLPLAGILLTLVGPVWVCVLSALGYLPMVYEGWRLRRTDLGAREQSGDPKPLREALRFIMQSRALVNVLLIVLAVSLFVANFQVLVAALIVQNFQGGSTLVGWMAALPAVGALIGSTVTGRPRVVRVRWASVAAVMGALCVAALAVPGHLPLVGLGLIVVGLSLAGVTNISNALLLGAPQVALRGRIAAITKMVTMCGTTAGAFMAGMFSGAWGVEAAFMALGAGTLLLLLVHAVLYRLGLTPAGREPAE